jgi:thiol-disulfide isomerase/thioredoxin
MFLCKEGINAMRGRKPARYKLSAKDRRYLTEIATDGQLIQWIAKRARILLALDRGEREGIKAGTPAPSFRLPDIYGRTVSLEEYRDRRVLLVLSDPHCGPCDQLAPHLVQLHRRHRANNLAVVMVGHGDPEENRRTASSSR